MANMTSNERAQLAKGSLTALKILQEQKRNKQAVEAENRKSDVFRARAMFRNAEIAEEEYTRINRKIKENTEESLKGATKVEAAYSKMLDKFKGELNQANIDWQTFYDGLAEYTKEKPALLAARVDMAKVDEDLAELNRKADEALKKPKILVIKVDDTELKATFAAISKAFETLRSLPVGAKNPFSAPDEIFGLATGGFIPGVGSGDIVPAMLEPGEFVMRKASVRSFGTAFFAALNNMSSPRIPAALSRMSGSPRLAFAAGGLVPGSKAGAEKTYNLNLNVSGKKYPLMGRREVVTALAEQLRREGLTT
jgi:hypothetical protein